MTKLPMAYCPECYNPIRLRSTLLRHQLVKCGTCGEILSLVTYQPPLLTWAADELGRIEKSTFERTQ